MPWCFLCITFTYNLTQAMILSEDLPQIIVNCIFLTKTFCKSCFLGIKQGTKGTTLLYTYHNKFFSVKDLFHVLLTFLNRVDMILAKPSIRSYRSRAWTWQRNREVLYEEGNKKGKFSRSWPTYDWHRRIDYVCYAVCWCWLKFPNCCWPYICEERQGLFCFKNE